MAASRSSSQYAARFGDDTKRSSSSEEGEMHDVSIGEDDEASLRPSASASVVAHSSPTMVQLPSRVKGIVQAQPPPTPTVAVDMIDPDFLKELPPEIQQEILLEHAAAQKRATEAAIQEAMLEGELIRDESDALDERDLSDEAEGGGIQYADSEWTCHVCTFANHPQLPSCEMCDTARPQEAYGQWYDEEEHQAMSPASRERYSKLTQRIQSSVMATSLKKIRVPATPATTSLTQKDDPNAEDLLLAATIKIQQLHSSASQSLQQAKQSIMAKASAARRPSLLSPGGTPGKPPSAQAALLLKMLQDDLNTKCEPGDELYETLLVRLWNAIYQDAPPSPRKTGAKPLSPPLPRRPFERVSEGWVDIGFQGSNPDTDFRGGGLLALKCLVYVFEAFPHKMIEVVSAQKPTDSGRKWYPVCVAGINLTCMIAGLLRLGNGQFTKSLEHYWPLFEEPAAFYQLYYHAFIKMDAAWHRMNASFMEFGVVLKATRRMVVHILDQAPLTLDDLRVAAEKTFIDRFVVAVSKTFLSDTENGECPDPLHLLEDDNEVLLTSPRSALASIASRLTFSSSAKSSH